MTINPYPFSSLSQNILLTGKVNDKDCNVNSDYEDGEIGDGHYEKEDDIDEVILRAIPVQSLIDREVDN